jgi:serine protease Do
MRQSAMGTLLAVAALFVSAVAVLPAGSSAESLRDLLPFGRTHRIAKLLPSVVNISVRKLVKDDSNPSAKGEPRSTEAEGSGFVIDPSGLIVTNRHVIEDATDITVTLSDGTALPAKLLGTGGTIDLALLQVTPTKPLPKVIWGNSDNVRVGDQVLAVGNPLGLGESVSSGIVSAKNRDIFGSPFDDYIQTDAAINHGNSGGPLCNMRGHVIGVNTALYTPSATSGSVGLGFAIPGNDAQYVVDQIRRYGHLRQGWIGLRSQDMTPNIADAFGLHAASGAIVIGIDPASPAAHSGLQTGDVIVKFGKQIPKDSRALARLIADTPTGDTVPMLIWRDGKEQTVTVTVAEWPQPSAASAGSAKPAQAVRTDSPDLGLQTSLITEDARAKYKLAAGQAGVLVTAVAPRSAAEESGLNAGDVILRVQQTEVATPADVLSQFKAVREEKRYHVVLLVQGHDGLRWIPLSVGAPQ